MKRTKTTIAAAVAGLALAGVGIPAALAASSSTTTTSSATATKTPAPTPSPTATTSGNGNMCGYPSNRTPTLTLVLISPKGPVRAPAPLTFGGSLTSNKCIIPGSIVQLYSKTGNGPPTQVAQTTTDANGNYTYSPVPSVKGSTTYASYYVGPKDGAWDGTVSNTITVNAS